MSSLQRDTIGSFNTANGIFALLSNAANENSATGAGALLSDLTGGSNTANGALALERTPSVALTRPMERSRCLTAPPAGTQRLVLRRLRATLPAVTTPPAVRERSYSIVRVNTTVRLDRARYVQRVSR